MSVEPRGINCPTLEALIYLAFPSLVIHEWSCPTARGYFSRADPALFSAQWRHPQRRAICHVPTLSQWIGYDVAHRSDVAQRPAGGAPSRKSSITDRHNLE